MDTETEFDELARIRPGVTTVRQLRDRLGNADELLPSTDLSDTDESGVFLHFKAEGIGVFYINKSDSHDLTIDEVRLLNGNTHTLKCGLHIGLARQNATQLIRQVFTVINEYDDSVYFVPSRKLGLVACAEFMGENAITSLELYIGEST